MARTCEPRPNEDAYDKLLQFTTDKLQQSLGIPVIGMPSSGFDIAPADWRNCVEQMLLPEMTTTGVSTRALLAHMIENYLEMRREFEERSDKKVEVRQLSAIMSPRRTKYKRPADLHPHLVGRIAGRIAHLRGRPEWSASQLEALLKEVDDLPSFTTEVKEAVFQCWMLSPAAASHLWLGEPGADIPSQVFISHFANFWRHDLNREVSHSWNGQPIGPVRHLQFVRAVCAIFSAAGIEISEKAVQRRVEVVLNRMRANERGRAGCWFSVLDGLLPTLADVKDALAALKTIANFVRDQNVPAPNGVLFPTVRLSRA